MASLGAEGCSRGFLDLRMKPRLHWGGEGVKAGPCSPVGGGWGGRFVGHLSRRRPSPGGGEGPPLLPQR